MSTFIFAMYLNHFTPNTRFHLVPWGSSQCLQHRNSFLRRIRATVGGSIPGVDSHSRDPRDFTNNLLVGRWFMSFWNGPFSGEKCSFSGRIRLGIRFQNCFFQHCPLSSQLRYPFKAAMSAALKPHVCGSVYKNGWVNLSLLDHPPTGEWSQLVFTG